MNSRYLIPNEPLYMLHDAVSHHPLTRSRIPTTARPKQSHEYEELSSGDGTLFT